MSLKSFAGTLTIGALPFAVTGSLSKVGLRVQGSLIFADDITRIFPIDYRINGLAFTSLANMLFVDPEDRVVLLSPLVIADTSIDADFTNLTITEAPCTIDGPADVLTLDIDSVEVVVDYGALADEGPAVEFPSIYSPERLRINEIANPYDHFGDLLSVNRIPGESNESYLNRIRRAASHPSNSTYLGLLNGVLRALNLEAIPTARVTIKEGLESISGALRLTLDGTSVKIYETWISEQDQLSGLRPTIEQETTLEGFTIAELVDWINQSEFYEAKLLANGDELANFIIKYDSIRLVTDYLRPQNITKLTEENLIPGSLSFLETEYMNNELAEAASLTQIGDFKIHHSDGRIEIFDPPKEQMAFTYMISDNSFELEYSPVRLIDYSTEAGQELLFNQVELDLYDTEEGHYINGLPTEEGYKVIRQVLDLEEFPQRWGE